MIKVLCLDFDDTINDYPGWKEEGFKVILGKPLPGVKEAIKYLRNRGWMVLVHSTRCGYSGGLVAISTWLNSYNIMVDGVSSNKPPAHVYVDDKTVTFNGDWPATIDKIINFKHWKEQRKHGRGNSKRIVSGRAAIRQLVGSATPGG